MPAYKPYLPKWLAIASVCLGHFAFSPRVKAADPGPSTRPFTAPATVEPFEQTDLYPRIGGYVSEVSGDIGDRVKARHVLATIAQPELDKELAEYKAMLVAKQKLHEAADAAMQQAVQALAVAKQQVVRYDAEAAVTDATFARQRELASGKAITDQQLDEARGKAEVARADAAIARAKVGAAEADVKGAEAAKAVAAAQVDVATAQVQKIEAMKTYLEVTAPYDGVVTRRTVNRGDLATATPSAKNLPMFTVQRVDKLRVRCDVPEASALAIAIGDQVSLRFVGSGGATITGTVARTSYALDPAMRSLRVEIDLDNAEGKYRPGMYLQVVFTPGAPAAAVPAAK